MIQIDDKDLGVTAPAFIIAEAGVNHNGELKLAKKLVDVAVEAGADAVKFQTFNTKELVAENAEKPEYQEETTDKQESQFAMLEKLELSLEDHYELKRYCKGKEILLLSTPFDFKSVDLLEELKVPLYKVGSSDTNNLPLLKYIAEKGKPIILSTGMSNLSEVEAAVDTIQKTGNNNLILLHCVSNYPAHYQEVNLKAIDTLRQTFKVPVGYSDHTLGIEVPIAAVSRGAAIIEKHFTLDKEMEGPDHQASLEPKELKQMVTSIRNVEQSLGTGIKKPTKSEEENKKTVRKSLIANQKISCGEILTREKIKIKRPGTGLSPEFLNIVLGMEVKREISADNPLSWEDLKSEKA
jgi:N-acetylneuraminate synthase